MKTRYIGSMGAALIAFFLSAWFSSGQTNDQADLALKAAIKAETVDGDLRGAIEQYKKIAALPGAGRATIATALLRMGQCHEKLGAAETQEARKAYEQVVREYSDQAAVAAEARAKLAALTSAGAASGSSTLTVRRVSTRLDVTGKVSPDGRFLSFTDWGNGGNLAIHELVTGEERRLTGTGSLEAGSTGFAEFSVPSPDGKSVAYEWRGERSDLCVVGLDGSKPRVLKTSGDGVIFQFPLAWSPDGTQLLAEFVKADGSRDMKLVAVADGSAKLVKAVGRDQSPGGVFSPDGRYIAYATKEGLALFELETGQESALIADRSNPSVLGWSPNGKHILFSSERSGSADAWLIAVAGGKAQGEPIFVKKDWGYMPMGFTRSGAFYYVVNNSVGDVQVAELDPANGNMVSPPQSGSRRGNTWTPDWSPDGRFLAFTCPRDRTRAVVIHSMETGEERELRIEEWTIGVPGGSLRWTPDGKAVVIPASAPGKGENLIRIDVQTGQTTSLMPLPGTYGFPRFELSPNGKTIFYVDREAGRLVAHDVLSGLETEILKKEGLLAGVVSPDGQRLLIQLAGESMILLVMPTVGGEARELVRIDAKKEAPGWGSPSWAPDGRYALFIKGVKGEDRHWQLWRVSVDGGEPQPLGLTYVGRLLAGPRFNPDGRRLALSTLKVNLEIWVMENFLPAPKASM